MKQIAIIQEAIQDWLIEQVACLAGIEAHSVDIQQPFKSLGLSSGNAIKLTEALNSKMGSSISPTTIWSYPTIEKLAHFLARTDNDDKGVKLETEETRLPEPVAIVGMGCRFPGAKNVSEFWRLLKTGGDAITEVPSSRWNIDDYYDPKPGTPQKMSTRWGGFIEDVDKFDPEFFSIAPREATFIDPHQRILLEVTWEALESSGINPADLAGSQTGVYIGIFSDGSNPFLSLNAYSGTGNAVGITANRISYVLDLRGPSEAIDTACSSSLVAIHNACQSLRTRDCNLALAGGVNLILSPDRTIIFSQAKMMSPGGRCKTFDASADGYVRSEGCGVLVMKRLSDAVRDRDPILAVIRGSAINQDGRSNGLTAPNGSAQQDVIRQALNNARMKPDEISYIEAHGTGTSLGDPIEMQALLDVFSSQALHDRKCFVGSLKTNIGHSEAAAGVAGVIKTILSMQHEEIPPHLHLKKLNPLISLENSCFSIPTKREQWPRNTKKRVAGVSSFSFGGTNAHVVIEEAPASEPVKSEAERPLHLCTLSARSRPALQDLVERYSHHLEENPQESIADLCFTANAGRSHFTHRIAAMAKSSEQLREKLEAFSTGKEANGFFQGELRSADRPKVAFLFTGQGSQYIGMSRELYATQPTFRKALDRCDEVLKSYLKQPLLSVLYPDKAGSGVSLIDETAYTQPALFALEYALAQLWQSWGLKPDAVMGHSVGEYVAACVAGVFSLEDGLKLIAKRAELMQALPKDGAMAAVMAPESIVSRKLAAYGADLSIAAYNGPKLLVISGKRVALEQVLAECDREGITTQRLAVSHAFHSSLMEPMLKEFEKVLKEVQFSEPQIPLVSNVTGEFLTKEQVTPEYFLKHIRSPVRFAPSIEFLTKQGYSIMLEVGPQPVLLGMARRCVSGEVDRRTKWLPSLRRGKGDWEQLLESLGNVYVSGIKIDWSGFEKDYPRRKISLPTYPFQRQRYWIETEGQPRVGKKYYEEWLYELSWKRQALSREEEVNPSRWLILSDGRGQALAEQLQARGHECDLEWNEGQPYQGVIHLLSLGGSSELTPEHLKAEVTKSLKSTLELVQRLTQQKQVPRLILVTEKGQRIQDGYEINVAEAPLWGLGRVIAGEHPELKCLRIDVESFDKSLEGLCDEIESNRSEEEVGFYGGERFVSRLVRREAKGAEKTVGFKGGAYLITGGRGALGLVVGKWLAEQGAQQLLLMGRSAPDGAALEAIAAMEQSGAKVEVVCGDVTKRADVRQAIRKLQESGCKSKGIIHAAGSLDDGVLMNLSWERFEEVLWPKVLGGWNLYEETRGIELDFFVNFSSLASLLGNPGQGNYAAANAFLDGLAQQSSSHRMQSLNWGGWREGGMAAETIERGKAVMNGIGLIGTDEGLKLLQQVMSSEAREVGVLPIQWSEFSKHLVPGHEPAKLRELLEELEEWRKRKLRGGESDLTRSLQGVSEARQREILFTYLRSEIAGVLGSDVVKIDATQPLIELGLDSLMAVELRNRISNEIGWDLPATVIFNYPNLKQLAEYILLELGLRQPKLHVKLQSLAPSLREPIAVVGMSCRFPGGANDVEGYWQLLHGGVDAISEVPKSRWDTDMYYDPNPDAPGKLSTRWGGFLQNMQVEEFDPKFFGISPREAISLDPQQRLLMEVSWEALEDSGIDCSTLVGSKTGVFVGIGSNDYQGMLAQQGLREMDMYALTGTRLSAAAGRLSYVLGLEGPSMAVDTACSASLYALHYACQSLRTGDCETALAGGVSLLLAPESTIGLSKGHFMAPDGRCKTFDASADGFVRGEGCGVLVLKRLSDAERDGDRIYAVIRGSAVNQDGRSGGLTVPNGPAQEEVIRKALENAGVKPEEIDYVEAHGTGTQLGDPIEVGALSEVLGGGRDKQHKLNIGSVKTNIGHLEAAAGVASVMKVILALQHEEIPKHLHFTKPSGQIAWQDLPVRVVQEAMLWPHDGHRRLAGVNGFAFQGSNAHVVIEEAPSPVAVEESVEECAPNLLTLSAKSEQVLKEVVVRYITHLKEHADQKFEDICYTANVGRTHFGHRLAVVAKDRTEAVEQLKGYLAGKDVKGLYSVEVKHDTMPSQSIEIGSDPNWQHIYSQVGESYTQGGEIDWETLYCGEQRKKVSLPTYPFQRQRYWIETRGPRTRAGGSEPSYELLGVKLELASHEDEVVFESELSGTWPEYLGDHRVFGEVVVPGVAYVELGLIAAREVYGQEPVDIEDMAIEQALVLREKESRRVQVVVKQEEREFEIYSHKAGVGEKSWVLHAHGKITDAVERVEDLESLDLLRERLKESDSIAGFYEGLRQSGLQYGDRFQTVKQLFLGEREILGEIHLGSGIVAKDYQIHPTLMDGCLQILGALLRRGKPDSCPDLYLPIGIKQVWLKGDVGPVVWSHGRLTGGGFAETLRGDVTLYNELGEVLGVVRGLQLKRASEEAVRGQLEKKDSEEWYYELLWKQQDLKREKEVKPGRWLILAGGQGEALVEKLRARGHYCDVARADEYQKYQGYGGVIHLLSLECSAQPSEETLKTDIKRSLKSALELVQDLSRQQQACRLVLVTERAQAVKAGEKLNIAQSPLWGLGRVIGAEHPELSCLRIDVESYDDCLEELCDEIEANETEDEVGLYNKKRYVARLAKSPVLRETLRVPEGSENYRLRVSRRGALDNLQLTGVRREEIGAGQVEIRVGATGLNFRDVLNVLGMYPGEAGDLGTDCAGEVVRVGFGVKELQVGDEVFGFATGCLARFTVTDERYVVKKPEGLSHAEAATLSTTFLTAEYGLETLAQLKRGEGVLIHAASGGVGLAAIQVARRLGAKIYVTAGSEAKRKYLRSLGIQHIYDSRSTKFYDEILADTKGEGIDVVLNSLTGEAIEKGLRLLRAGGRFIEIGKAELWTEAQVTEVNPKVRYFTLALDELMMAEPERTQEMLRWVLARLASGEYQVLPVTRFSLARAKAAFRYMAQAQHMGKVVVEQQDMIRGDGTYLISGGLGALGLEVGKWLAREGAKEIVLMGRSAPSDVAQTAIEEMTQVGTTVQVVQGDVTKRADVRSALSKIRKGGGKLSGIIHAAGTLDDGVLVQQDWERFEKVLWPKILGSWNLREETKQDELDFFVNFSSLASMLGNPGQGNYAASNAFLDAIAQDPTSHPMQSINWGGWQDGGMAAETIERGKRLRSGIELMSSEEGLEALARIIQSNATQIGVMPIVWSEFERNLPVGRTPAKFIELLEQYAGGGKKIARGGDSVLLNRLQEAPQQKRREIFIAYLRSKIFEVLGGRDIEIAEDQPLIELGLDSLMAVELKNRLSIDIGWNLSATAIFDYPALGRLTDYILSEVGLREKPIRTVSPSLAPSLHEPIAVVGMSCRFPGGANDLEGYWQLLHRGMDGISEVPKDRWDIDAYYDPDPDTPGKMNTRWGGFLKDIKVDEFDPRFFGISVREAMSLDPQQRLLMEVSWEALEDAGLVPAELIGSKTGVFIGMSTSDYYNLLVQGGMQQIDVYLGTGTSHSAAAGRLSYVLGLEGPSMAIDTACSSSLYALHYACQSLRTGDCEKALVGGVNLILSPGATIYFSRGGFMAPDGRCKTFDESANGYVRGEGCGVLVLKRLSDAQRDGDRIYAAIRGSAVNQDGRSGGLTIPNGPAQEEVIRHALANAGVKPAEIDYVEAHGTGTQLGDPIEVNALAKVMGEGRNGDRPISFGSVKTNIGHLEAAAGMASVIKVILSLQHDEIPKQLHFEKPNQKIAWEELPVRVAKEALPWRRNNGRRIAGVSGFAFQGSNAHVIIEEAPSVVTEESTAERPENILTLSAKSERALRVLVERYIDHLTKHSDQDFADICYTSNIGRSHFDYRLALVAKKTSQAIEQLKSHRDSKTVAGLWLGKGNRGAEKPSLPVMGSNPNWTQILSDVAKLYVQGYNINFADFYRQHKRSKVALPNYPFERMRCWIKDKTCQ